MADNKKTTKKKTPAKPENPPQASVSREEFEGVAKSVGTLNIAVEGLVDLIKSGALSAPAAKTPEEVKADKEVEKAGANKYTVNPEWEDIAREIIGEAVDHTEIEYIKGGGMKFTVFKCPKGLPRTL